MSGLSHLKGHGPILAVVDGRFLPIHEFAIEIDNDVEQVQTFGGSSFAVSSGKQTISLGLRTYRPAHVREERVEWIRLYNRKYEALFEDANVTATGLEIGGGNEYSIEATSLGFELTER